MRKIFLLSIFILLSYSNDIITNPKKCEVIKLTKFTTLVSCYKIDYIVQTKEVVRDDEDTIKKIIALTKQDGKIIINNEDVR